MRNVILEGDCLERMKEIPNASIDMILCDLPYGTTSNEWDKVIPFEPLWAAYARVTKPNAPIILTASQPFTTRLIASNYAWFRYCWVFKKVRPANVMLAKKQPLKIHEDVVVFGREPPNYFPRDLTPVTKPLGGTAPSKSTNFNAGAPKEPYKQEFTGYPKSIIDLPLDDGALDHPTQKPAALFSFLIRTYSNPGDLVLDNCAGSGTTGIAAKSTGRAYILIEKNPDYFAAMTSRIEAGANGNLLAGLD